ncbi:MAG: hypothetical protein WA183_07235 [Chthoniobacterales bacterium]
MGGSKRVPHWWDLSGSFRTNPTPERRLIFNRHAAIKVKTHAKIKAECGSQQGMAWAFLPGFHFRDSLIGLYRCSFLLFKPLHSNRIAATSCWTQSLKSNAIVTFKNNRKVLFEADFPTRRRRRCCAVPGGRAPAA